MHSGWVYLWCSGGILIKSERVCLCLHCFALYRLLLTGRHALLRWAGCDSSSSLQCMRAVHRVRVLGVCVARLSTASEISSELSPAANYGVEARVPGAAARLEAS